MGLGIPATDAGARAGIVWAALPARTGADEADDDPAGVMAEGRLPIAADSTGAQLSGRTPNPPPSAAGPLGPTPSRWREGSVVGEPARAEKATDWPRTGSVAAGAMDGRSGDSPTRARRCTGADVGSRHEPPSAGRTRRTPVADSAYDEPTASPARTDDDGVEEKVGDDGVGDDGVGDDGVGDAGLDPVRSDSTAPAGTSSEAIDAVPSVGATSGISAGVDDAPNPPDAVVASVDASVAGATIGRPVDGCAELGRVDAATMGTGRAALDRSLGGG